MNELVSNLYKLKLGVLWVDAASLFHSNFFILTSQLKSTTKIYDMKHLVFTASLIFMGFFVFAQSPTTKPSPAAKTTASIEGNTITIDYHQPSVKGRKIWGALVPYGKVWRAGANQTTSIAFSSDAKVHGKKVPAGKYAFFVIPNEKDWTIILNKTIKWGAFSYKQEEDVLRFTVPVEQMKSSEEKLTYSISETGEVSLLWANAKASFDVQF